ncbi:hypothetical protein CF326_g4063, partial [Tilletia indica]
MSSSQGPDKRTAAYQSIFGRPTPGQQQQQPIPPQGFGPAFPPGTGPIQQQIHLQQQQQLLQLQQQQQPRQLPRPNAFTQQPQRWGSPALPSQPLPPQAHTPLPPHLPPFEQRPRPTPIYSQQHLGLPPAASQQQQQQQQQHQSYGSASYQDPIDRRASTTPSMMSTQRWGSPALPSQPLPPQAHAPLPPHLPLFDTYTMNGSNSASASISGTGSVPGSATRASSYKLGLTALTPSTAAARSPALPSQPLPPQAHTPLPPH